MMRGRRALAVLLLVIAGCGEPVREAQTEFVEGREYRDPSGARFTVKRLPKVEGGWHRIDADTIRYYPFSVYEVAADHWAHRAVAAVLHEEYGVEPYHTRSGGSIPVCSLFRRALGADTVIFGFALPDERFHAPDEFFRLASFERGQRAWCSVLEALAAARQV